MKKRSSLQKKRAAARRKKRLKQRKRLSVQQRLARLAKEQALANLIATLSQFPTNLTGAIESEHEEHPHLLKLGRSLWNVTLNSEAYPQRFERLQPRVQQQLSVTARVSLPQRLTSSLSVGAATVRREAALLWEAPGQRIWPLAPVRCRMTLPASMPQVVTHARGSILSPVTPGSPYVVAQPTFSCSITLKQPPAKLFCQEGLLIPPQSSGYPARGWKGTYRMAPAAAVNPDVRADNPPGAEQSSSESIKGKVGRKVIFKKHPREARSHRVTKGLRKTAGFIRKSPRPDEKPSLRRVLNTAKKQRYLDQPAGSILRLRGWLRADDTGLGMQRVKLLGRKQRGVFHSRSIRRSDWQRWLKESRAVSSTDSHCPLVTLIPTAVVPRKSKQPAENRSHQEGLPIPPLSSGYPAVSRRGSCRTAPAGAVNPDQRADNPPGAEQSSSNDIKEDIGHERLIFKEHLRETARLYQSSKYLRKTAGFIRKSSRPDKKPSLRRVLNRAKKQRQLGQPGGSILRLCGWSRVADTGLWMKRVKLLGRKQRGVFHSRSIRRGDWQHFTLIPPAAVPCRRPFSVQPSPTAAVDPDLRADSPPGAEQSSSESIKGRVGRKVIFKEHLRETARLYQSSRYLRKTAGFIRKSSRPDKKLSFTATLKSDNPAAIVENVLGAEQLSSGNIKGDIEHERRFVVEIHPQKFRPHQATEDSSDNEDDALGAEQDSSDNEDDALGAEQDFFDDEKEITGQTLFEAKEESPEAIRARRVGSCPACCLDGLLTGDYPYPIPEGETAEHLVKTFLFLQAMSAARPYDYGCDEHWGISYRPPPRCSEAGLLPSNWVPLNDRSWMY